MSRTGLARYCEGGIELSEPNEVGRAGSEDKIASTGRRQLLRAAVGGARGLLAVAAESSLLSRNAAVQAQSLNDLTDVTITAPRDFEVLLFDESGGQWINAGGVPSLDNFRMVGLAITATEEDQAEPTPHGSSPAVRSPGRTVIYTRLDDAGTGGRHAKESF